MVLLVATVFLSSAGLAAWSINDLDESHSHDVTSNSTETKQLVRLLDNDNDPVNSSGLEDSGWDFKWAYNDTYDSNANTETGFMQHLAEGYWYANFSAKHINGSMEYELIPGDPDSDEINVTEKIGTGNLTVEVQNDFSKQYKAGKEISIEVNVTNIWDGADEDSANVDIYFTNGTWTSGLVSLGYNSNKDLYTNNVELPSKTNSTYITHINATHSGASYNNANGSQSLTLETFPAIEGELAYLNTTGGCNNNSMFTECERDAEIDIGFNITSSSADNVNMTMMLNNTTSGNWEVDTEKRLSENSGLFETSLTIPDIDTSEYDNKIMLRFNATNEDREFVLTRNLTYRSFTIRDRGSPTAYQGSDYTVELLFARYFSLSPLNSTRFTNASIDVSYPDGDTLTSFDMGDMSYDESSGLFTRDVSIPSDAENGTYDIDVEAFNTYSFKNTFNSKFTVEDIQASFNTSGDISTEIDKTGVHEINLTMTSKVNTDKTLSVDIDDSIENITEVDGGGGVDLDAEEMREVPIEFNITTVDDYSGEITFTDDDIGFSETIDVEIDSPTCLTRETVLCLQDHSGWLNVTSDERGHVEETLTLLYLGDKNGSTDIEASVSGDVADYLEFDNSSFELSDSREVVLNYTVDEPGNFTGEVTFEGDEESISFDTKLWADIEARETGLDAPGEIDLGYLPSGDSITKTIEISNTGTLEIEDITASSSEYTVSMSSTDLAEDETSEVDLSFESVGTESGTVTLEGTTSEDNISSQISVTATPVDNYAERTSELEQRVIDLSSQVNSSNLQSQLQNVETMIPQIETAYNSGNYEEAQQQFQEAQSILDSVASQAQSSPGGTTQTNGQTGGGGGGIIALIASLIVVLLIGFIAYTSIIPEEGDPLYNVLGR